MCKRRDIIDKKILIGRKEKVPVRIIIILLPAKQLEERIRKAKKDRDKRLNHSPDYYEWIKYNVFITNVQEETLSAQQTAKVYRVRWEIEIPLSCWGLLS